MALCHVYLYYVKRIGNIQEYILGVAKLCSQTGRNVLLGKNKEKGSYKHMSEDAQLNFDKRRKN